MLWCGVVGSLLGGRFSAGGSVFLGVSGFGCRKDTVTLPPRKHARWSRECHKKLEGLLKFSRVTLTGPGWLNRSDSRWAGPSLPGPANRLRLPTALAASSVPCLMALAVPSCGKNAASCSFRVAARAVPSRIKSRAARLAAIKQGTTGARGRRCTGVATVTTTAGITHCTERAAATGPLHCKRAAAGPP